MISRLCFMAIFFGMISHNISDRSVIATTEIIGAGLLSILKNKIDVRFAESTRQIFVPINVVVNSLSGLFMRKCASVALLFPFFLRLFNLNLFAERKAVSEPAKKDQNMNSTAIIIALFLNPFYLQ